MSEKENHIILNGDIIAASEPVLMHNNRAFCYGDAMFETLHAFGTEIQFADEHFNRLYRGLQAIHIKTDSSIAQAKLVREMVRLLNRNKIFGGARIRLTIFRESGGLYTPMSSKACYLIETTSLEHNYYELNSKGKSIDVYYEIPKPATTLSAFKTGNALLYVMAGHYAMANNLDDCLLVNSKKEIVESFHSNVFLIKNKQLITPSVEQGCVDGVMRHHVLKIANQMGMRCCEGFPIHESNLPEADEIFLTNAIEGIQWVLAYRDRRFFNTITKEIASQLNKQVFGK